MTRLLAAVLASAVLAGAGSAQMNPRGTARVALDDKEISVEYGRPSLKGRTVQQMLGQLNPGDVWRAGADRSTTFSATADLLFGDVTIPKGDYSLWVRRETATSWTLVLNKKHGQWGTQHDASQDLAAIPLKEEKLSQPVEQVTIDLEKAAGGGEITIQWGDMELSASFKGK